MKSKIFRGNMLVSVLTMLVCLVLLTGIFYNYFTNQIVAELSSETEYLAPGAVEKGGGYFAGISPGDGKRITLIDTDGTVLYDSEADAANMENHSDREEVQEAQKDGTGSSERYSKTLSEKTTYFARRISNGKILRVSCTQYTVWVLLFGILQPLIIVVFILITLSAILAARTSKKIVDPINKIDPSAPDIDDKYDEFSPLIHKIRVQNAQIEDQLDKMSRLQKEFQSITENMSEGLLVVDTGAIILSCNRAALRLLGAQKPGEHESVFVLCRHEEFMDAVHKALSGKHCETQLSGNSSVNIIANPVFRSEQVNGAVVLLMDVTEKKQRETLRREFTSNVSHELKTPLTSVYGMSELIMSGTLPQKDTIDFAISIHEETGRLISLVEDILKLGRLDEGVPLCEKQTVDLYTAARGAVSRITEAANRKKVSVELCGEHAKINAVPKLIDELILNLCDNAVKYNRDGGDIRVSVSDKDSTAVLAVEDTGIGIPPEHLGRVTERFYRVDKSHSKKIGGTGLGLSIVKHIVAYHGGTLKIDSTEDKGTTVTVTFNKL